MSGGIGPRSLKLGTRWRWLVSFTPHPLYPESVCKRWRREKSPFFCPCQEL